MPVDLLQNPSLVAPPDWPQPQSQPQPDDTRAPQPGDLAVAQTMNPPVQPGTSSDPGTPVDTSAQPQMQDRTLSTADSSTFKFLKAANPDDPNDAAIVDAANHYLQAGKKLEDLDAGELNTVWKAVNGSAQPSDDVVLNNKELFYQLNFRNGKYQPQLLDEIGKPEFAAQATWNFIKSPFSLAWSAITGAGQAIGADVKQVQEHGIGSLPEFLIGHNIATATEGLAKTEAFYSGLPIGAQDAAQDLWIRANRPFAHNPVEQEQLDRQQSEVIRTQALADKQGQDMVGQAKSTVANVIGSAGLTTLANQVQNAQTPEGIATLAQMATDPLSYVEFGAGKLPFFAGKVEQMGTRFQRLEEATKDLAQAGAEHADNQVKRTTFEAIRDSPTSSAAEVQDANKALAAHAPAEAQSANDLAAAQAEHTAASAAVANDVAPKANTVSNARATVATLANLGGGAAQVLGKMVEYSSPIKLVGAAIDKFFPNAPDYVKEGARFLAARMTGGLEEAFGTRFATGLAGKALQNIGRTISMMGPQLMLGRTSLPFFKAMAENTQGLTRAAMSTLDNQLVYAIPDTVRAGVKGAAIGGAAGYLGSGGQADPTVSGAGMGGVLGAVGAGMGQIRQFNSPATLHVASIGDRAKFMPTLSPENANLYTKLDPQTQLHIASMARAHPDLHLNFFDDPSNTAFNGHHQVVPGINGPVSVASINVSGDNPVLPILQHEIGHHIASHGLESTITGIMLGDPITNTPGIFTQRNPDGTPMTQLGPNGVRQFVPNADFEGYKGRYNSKLPPGTPAETDHGIAQEMFAELHAQGIANPQNVQRMMRGLVPSDGLIGSNVVKNWLSKIGVPMDATTGSPILTDAVARTRGLSNIISDFYRKRNLKLDNPESERGAARVDVTTARKGTTEFDRLASQFDATSDLKRGPDGTLVTDLAGRPQVVPEKQVDAQHHQFTTTLLKTLSALPPETFERGTNPLKLTTDRQGREFYTGQDMPEPVLSALEKTNQYNPNQMLNMRKLNEAMKRDDGTMFTTVYNTAGRSGKYATLPAKERAITPISWQISPDKLTTNIKSLDPEQLHENITKAMKRKAVATIWGSKIDTMADDVRTYLGNLNANRPGETGIGLQKKGVINQLFGFNTEANPTVAALQLKNPSVIKDYRIDRINRLQELSGTTTPFHFGTYEKVYGYMQPRGMGEPVPGQPVAEGEDPNRNAIPVTMRTTSGGNKVPVEIPYDITKAPLVADKQPPDKLSGENNFGHVDFLTKPDQQKLTHLDNASAVTDYADKLVTEANRWKDDPRVMEAKNWYDTVLKYLKKGFKGDKQLFAELLSATSPQTGVVQNFDQALEAYRLFRQGKYDDAIREFKRTGKITPDMKPTKANGTLYGFNSDAVLKVLAGKWLDSVEGPKTPNFFRNLFQRGTDATIDMWAARTMHRLGHEGVEGAPEQWRIQPKSESGVSNLDFAFSQEAFKQAADRLGMKAHQLQAILWYGEKVHYANQGYTKGGASAALASFIPQLKEYAARPEFKPVAADTRLATARGP